MENHIIYISRPYFLSLTTLPQETPSATIMIFHHLEFYEKHTFCFFFYKVDFYTERNLSFAYRNWGKKLLIFILMLQNI
uniref:Uncharacterized protein n=1 Tax=Anguilla anguilla TaxID=7936 RepID=A0A0E9SQ98_ANGAN